MKHITTDITLNAPVERLWELLTDIGLYPHWNPLFRKSEGQLDAGQSIELMVELPEIAPFTIRAKIMEIDPQRAFSWRYTLAWGGLFNWRYSVFLEPEGTDATKYVQSSLFGGLLGPLFGLGLGGPIQQGLAEMNRALKRWGEKGNIICLKC